MKNNKTIAFLALTVVSMHAWVNPVWPVEIPEAKPDQGLVIFYRLSSFKGGAIRFNVNHATGSIGILGSGTFLYKYLDPGEHTFWSQVISKDAIKIKVEAGKTFYIQGKVKMGVYAGRPKFEKVKESKATEDLAKLE